MKPAFWIRRFFTVACGAFAVIFVAQWLKGHPIAYCAMQALAWSVLSATVFTVARIHQSRRGQHCALCRDTPEMQPHD
jgi:hypothetical protein